MKKVILRNKKYTLDEIYDISTRKYHISLSDQLKKNITTSRLLIKEKLNLSEPIYGINTGFGKLSQIKIDDTDIDKLQKNLLLSHAVGVGDNSPDIIVKIILLLKIISFTKGNSGVSLDLVEMLQTFFNNNCLPIIPLKGSVGASGDLAPLSHMALALIGVGDMKYKNDIISSKKALKKINLTPIKLRAKEGLALINGTQFSTAYGVFCLNKLHRSHNILIVLGLVHLQNQKLGIVYLHLFQ